jgi:ABC-type transport system involved in cytochrome c biogenesis permease component
VPSNNPDNFPLLTWLWVIGMSVLGSIVRTISIQEKVYGWRLIGRLIANAIVSIFIGIITAALCVHYSIEFWFTVSLVALSAHMGTPVLIFVEAKLMGYIKTKKGDDL